MDSEKEHGKHKDHVFVKHVRYQVAVPTVSLPPVHEQQLLKMFKLPYRIVARPSSLLSLES